MPLFVFMVKMKKAFKNKKVGTVLGWLFALLAVIASFEIGNLTQANSISESLKSTCNIPTNVVGVILTILALIIIVGGIKSISKVSQVVVPAMAIFYVIAGLTVIIINIENVPAGLTAIFQSAIGIQPLAGGVAGTITASMMNAINLALKYNMDNL